jgi:hypothetical protein
MALVTGLKQGGPVTHHIRAGGVWQSKWPAKSRARHPDARSPAWPCSNHKLAELAGLTDAPSAASETARIAALNALLDRGFGKPTQPLSADTEMPAVIEFRWAPAEETLEPPKSELTIDGGDADDAGEPLRVVWSSD